jgi:hypothetical protein
MTDLYTQRRGMLEGNAKIDKRQEVIKERKIRVIHVLIIAQSELKQRGWNKKNNNISGSEPCSLNALIDFGCVSKLKNNDDFVVQRDIVYCVLNTVIQSMSRNKYDDFRVWEQKQNSQAVIEKALYQAYIACTRSL